MTPLQRRIKWKASLTIVGWLVFILYVLYSTYLLFFGFYRSYGLSEGYYPVNLVPFTTIMEYVVHIADYPVYVWFNNLVGNILLFVPLGALLPLLVRSCRRWGRMMLISFLMTLFIEVMQYMLLVGTLDVDDMLLNVCGGMIGYGCYKLVRMLLISLSRVGPQQAPPLP
ncbi:VanZ family protein [Paenibacillus taiwanensis]|uniref:VanZ family protein n=1 Tax=Paenibacillus taiwanensis TaxID=401638 RepID=UPI001B7FD71A|nr:VanZ family protein [Paenibacillus taiwanensis]